MVDSTERFALPQWDSPQDDTNRAQFQNAFKTIERVVANLPHLFTDNPLFDAFAVKDATTGAGFTGPTLFYTTAQQKFYRPIICTDCEGFGYFTCATCDGEGVVPDGLGQDIPCPDCGGTGRIDCLNCVDGQVQELYNTIEGALTPLAKGPLNTDFKVLSYTLPTATTTGRVRWWLVYNDDIKIASETLPRNRTYHLQSDDYLPHQIVVDLATTHTQDQTVKISAPIAVPDVKVYWAGTEELPVTMVTITQYDADGMTTTTTWLSFKELRMFVSPEGVNEEGEEVPTIITFSNVPSALELPLHDNSDNLVNYPEGSQPTDWTEGDSVYQFVTYPSGTQTLQFWDGGQWKEVSPLSLTGYVKEIPVPSTYEDYKQTPSDYRFQLVDGFMLYSNPLTSKWRLASCDVRTTTEIPTGCFIGTFWLDPTYAPVPQPLEP